MRRSLRLPALWVAGTLIAAPIVAPLSPAAAFQGDKKTATPEKAPCAVCVVREGSGDEPVRATAVHEGKTYYFCAEGCREEFLENPAEFIQAAAKPAAEHTHAKRPGASAVPT